MTCPEAGCPTIPHRPPITIRGEDIRAVHLHRRPGGELPLVEIDLEGGEMHFLDFQALDLIVKTAIRLCGLPPGART